MWMQIFFEMRGKKRLDMYNILCVHVLHVGQVDTEFPIQFDYNSQALDSNAFGCVFDQIFILQIYERNSLSLLKL